MPLDLDRYERWALAEFKIMPAWDTLRDWADQSTGACLKCEALDELTDTLADRLANHIPLDPNEY